MTITDLCSVAESMRVKVALVRVLDARLVRTRGALERLDVDRVLKLEISVGLDEVVRVVDARGRDEAIRTHPRLTPTTLRTGLLLLLLLRPRGPCHCPSFLRFGSRSRPILVVVVVILRVRRGRRTQDGLQRQGRKVIIEIGQTFYSVVVCQRVHHVDLFTKEIFLDTLNCTIMQLYFHEYESSRLLPLTLI